MINTIQEQAPEGLPARSPYRPSDFASDQEIRWCPGCGDYAIVKALRGAMARIGTDPDRVVCLSGIGCAARLPYYMSCYGLHTIHGRGATIASGLVQARPDLDVWLITGDGDGLSIGAGHMLHVMRRRHPLRILLFNNAVYGLTKGQASPTSPLGMVSPSTPFGHATQPVNPCLFALTAGAGFVARSADLLQAHLLETMVDTHAATIALQRPAFLEILQNCPVYHDQVFGAYLNRENREDRVLTLKEGDFLRYGKDQALVFDTGTMAMKSVRVSSDDEAEAKGVLRHNPANAVMASLLAQLVHPLPLGVIFRAAGEAETVPANGAPTGVAATKGEAALYDDASLLERLQSIIAPGQS